ncbi:hypothetical protein STEG23_022295 [Scotinomys teguina]
MCWLSWFLDPGGWSNTTTVGLYFIFPGICTLSFLYYMYQNLVDGPYTIGAALIGLNEFINNNKKGDMELAVQQDYFEFEDVPINAVMDAFEYAYGSKCIQNIGCITFQHCEAYLVGMNLSVQYQHDLSISYYSMMNSDVNVLM